MLNLIKYASLSLVILIMAFLYLAPEFELQGFRGLNIPDSTQKELPQIYIETQDPNLPKYKRPGHLYILSKDPSEKTGPHPMGISIRGNSSLRYEKKSYDIQLGKKQNWQKKHNRSLLGLRNDDDWKLGADYADKLGMRNFITHKIFHKMRQNKAFPKNSSVHIKHVEVHLNGEYRGLYTFMEQEDRKQYGLPKTKRFESNLNKAIDSIFDKFERQKTRAGRNLLRELGNGLYKARNALFPVREDKYQALYKSSLFGSDFTQLKGLKQKYPKDIHADYRLPLKNLIKFVDHSDKKAFDLKIWDHFDFDNLIDYFLLITMSGSVDNHKSNYLLAIDPNFKFHFIPWDLDNTWRLKHHKTGKILSTYDSFPFKSNRLFERILQNERFTNELKKRWKKYKKDLLSYDSLSEMFLSTYQKLKNSGAYRREFKRWNLIKKGQTIREVTEIDEVLTWIRKRQKFLDTTFNQL